MSGRRVVVILAGGAGSRFWPASTAGRPKQLLPLGGAKPLILETVERAAALVGLDNVRILTGGHLVEPFRRTVPDLEETHFLVEPRSRGTGPVLAWAAWELERAWPGTVMISLHADHVISPLESFLETVAAAVKAAETRSALVCIGSPPDRPETGYGYLELGERADGSSYRVVNFDEKPDRSAAERYRSSGRHLWNTGIFVWRAADLLESVRRWTPEINSALVHLERGDIEGFFSTVQPVSVDEGVLERADRVEAVRATFAWDDVGAWGALARTRESDEAGNVLIGRATAVESRDNIVWTEDGHAILFGVSGMVVVRTASATLVTTREAAPDLKRLLSRIDVEEE